MKVKIIQPDIYKPYKYFPDMDYQKYKLEMPKDVLDLRLHWVKFCDTLVDALIGSVTEVEKIIVPNYKINQELVNKEECDIIFIPHKIPAQIERPADKKVLYYMQIMTRWLFTFDPEGWGPATSTYPFDFQYSSSSEDVFDDYKNFFLNGNRSKFDQKTRVNRSQLIESNEIPNDDYIFFPCQIPHDESIRFFCDHPEIDIIKSIVSWAKEAKVNIVFKGHPQNMESMKPFFEITTGDQFYWSDASIHDLIEFSSGVFVINSGVGFEAIFHEKPIMTFGRADYDCVTVRSDIKDMHSSWTKFLEFKASNYKNEYRKFINWYCSEYCINITDTKVTERIRNKWLNHIEAVPLNKKST